MTNDDTNDTGLNFDDEGVSDEELMELVAEAEAQIEHEREEDQRILLDMIRRYGAVELVDMIDVLAVMDAIFENNEDAQPEKEGDSERGETQ